MSENFKENLKFINELSIHNAPSIDANLLVGATKTAPGAAVAPPGGQEGKPGAAVCDGNVVSFVSEVSGQNRQDILNSTLLAQLAANKKFNRINQLREWYDVYRTTLEKIAWVVQSSEFQRHEVSGASGSVNKVVIDILKSFVPGGQLELLQTTLNALQALSADDGRIKIFEHNTRSQEASSFQVGVASGKNDAVSFNIGSFLFKGATTGTTILFATFKTSHTEIEKNTQTMTLNTGIYNKVRDAINTKLGDHTKAAIDNIEI